MRDGMEILVRTIGPDLPRDDAGTRYALVRHHGYGGLSNPYVGAFTIESPDRPELLEFVMDSPRWGDKETLTSYGWSFGPLADLPDPPLGWLEESGICEEHRAGDPALCLALRLLLENEEEVAEEKVKMYGRPFRRRV